MSHFSYIHFSIELIVTAFCFGGTPFLPWKTLNLKNLPHLPLPHTQIVIPVESLISIETLLGLSSYCPLGLPVWYGSLKPPPKAPRMSARRLKSVTDQCLEVQLGWTVLAGQWLNWLSLIMNLYFQVCVFKQVFGTGRFSMLSCDLTCICPSP